MTTGGALMMLLELDPNVVRPGWTALLVTIALATALVFLFLSMRRQFRKVNAMTYEGDRPRTADTPDAEAQQAPRA